MEVAESGWAEVMNYYHILKYGDYKDLKTVYIPPESVEQVQRRWDNGQPIHTTTGSIPANQIREFELSDKPFNSQPLLESVAQAFNEPLFDASGSLQTRWVKKNVTQNKWDKFYSQSPGYKYLGEMGGMVTVAFRMALHDINQYTVAYCTNSEILSLTKDK